MSYSHQDTDSEGDRTGVHHAGESQQEVSIDQSFNNISFKVSGTDSSKSAHTSSTGGSNDGDDEGSTVSTSKSTTDQSEDSDLDGEGDSDVIANDEKATEKTKTVCIFDIYTHIKKPMVDYALKTCDAKMEIRYNIDSIHKQKTKKYGTLVTIRYNNDKHFNDYSFDKTGSKIFISYRKIRSVLCDRLCLYGCNTDESDIFYKKRKFTGVYYTLMQFLEQVNVTTPVYAENFIVKLYNKGERRYKDGQIIRTLYLPSIRFRDTFLLYSDISIHDFIHKDIVSMLQIWRFITNKADNNSAPSAFSIMRK